MVPTGKFLSLLVISINYLQFVHIWYLPHKASPSLSGAWCVYMSARKNPDGQVAMPCPNAVDGQPTSRPSQARLRASLLWFWLMGFIWSLGVMMRSRPAWTYCSGFSSPHHRAVIFQSAGQRKKINYVPTRQGTWFRKQSGHLNVTDSTQEASPRPGSHAPTGKILSFHLFILSYASYICLCMHASIGLLIMYSYTHSTNLWPHASILSMRLCVCCIRTESSPWLSSPNHPTASSLAWLEGLTCTSPTTTLTRKITTDQTLGLEEYRSNRRPDSDMLFTYIADLDSKRAHHHYLIRGWFPIFWEVEVGRLVEISMLVKNAPNRRS
jgi:hypothetical protein